MKSIMHKIESHTNKDQGKSVDPKELKTNLEKCFIDFRREFDLLCLEKFSEC